MRRMICSCESLICCSLVLVLLSVAGESATAEESATTVRFERIVLDDKFRSEGMAVADVNKDGKNDVVVGDLWYAAPSWKPHEIRKPRVPNRGGYTDAFAGSLSKSAFNAGILLTRRRSHHSSRAIGCCHGESGERRAESGGQRAERREESGERRVAVGDASYREWDYAKGVGGWICLFWPPDGGRDLQFGIWDLDGETPGLGVPALGILQWGLAQGGIFARRAAKLGFCIIHPAGGETALHNWVLRGAVRSRIRGASARGRNE